MIRTCPEMLNTNVRMSRKDMESVGTGAIPGRLTLHNGQPGKSTNKRAEPVWPDKIQLLMFQR
jgi:hypothetical protein